MVCPGLESLAVLVFLVGALQDSSRFQFLIVDSEYSEQWVQVNSGYSEQWYK